MNRAKPRKVAVDERVDERLAECPTVVVGDRHAEETDLHFLLDDPGLELRLNFLEGLDQRLAVELVHTHVRSAQHLEGDLVGRNVIAKKHRRSQKEQPRQRRPADACDRSHEAQRPVEFVVREREKALVATVFLDRLPDSYALDGVHICHRHIWKRHGRGIEAAERGLTLDDFVRVERNRLRRAVHFEAAAQHHSVRCRDKIG